MRNLKVIDSQNNNQMVVLTDDMIEKISQCSVNSTLSILNSIQEQQLINNPEFKEGNDVTPNEHIINVVRYDLDCDLFNLLVTGDDSADPWDICKPFRNMVIYADGTEKPNHTIKKRTIQNIIKTIKTHNTESFRLENISSDYCMAVWSPEYNSYYYCAVFGVKDLDEKCEMTDILGLVLSLLWDIKECHAMNTKIVRSDIIENNYRFLITWTL